MRAALKNFIVARLAVAWGEGRRDWGRKMIESDIRRAFEDALAGRSLLVPRGGVIADGKIHVCDVAAPGNHGKGDGRYLLYPDDPPAGGFQNWRDGLPWEKWTGNGKGIKPSAEEIARWEARRRKREEDGRQEKEKIALESQEMWARAGSPTFNHPYLSKKGIGIFAKHLKVDGDGKILVPLRDADGKLWNLQRIAQDGEKRFPTGGRVKGLYFATGSKLETEGTVIVAEGMATAASINEATGLPVAAAMFAGNLLPVGKAIREKFPKVRIVYFADHDKTDPMTGKKVGIEKAMEAAKETGGVAVIPPKQGDDANDIFVRDGAAAVRQVLVSATQTVQPLEDAGESTEPEPDAGPGILDPNEPLQSARLFVESHYRSGDTRTLHRYQGIFRAWDGATYQAVEDDEISCFVYGFLDRAFQRVKIEKEWSVVPFKPNKAKVANVIDALKAETFLSGGVPAPMWLEGNGPVPADELIVCKNCLVHLPTGRTFPNTPDFFAINALPVAFDPDAGEPGTLHRFLDDLFDDDTERRDTLQEIFGYLLTTDTRQQKIPLIPGPKRAGKGVIGRILRGLLGPANVCNPTLASLQSNFGLSSLLGKQVAIITDARLGRADQHVIAERLLSISGEDGIDIDRKYREPLTGVRLFTRFIILTNELPKVADVSGALASRFIVIPLMESFYGREDHGLTDRLLAELPQILNWSIAGWKRLQERGRFVQPSAGEEAIRELEDLSSPISAFLRERTADEAGFSTTPEEMYKAWEEWCEKHGRDHKGTLQGFCRDVRAARPNLKTTQPREGKTRKRVYQGIRLLSAWEMAAGQE